MFLVAIQLVLMESTSRAWSPAIPGTRRFRWWHQMLVLSLVLSFAFNCDIPYQPQAHPRKFTPPWMTKRTWRTQIWNHGPHLKDERTTGPYSLIESRSIYRDKHLNPAGYRTDIFYETLGYSTLVLILTCDPKRPPDQLIVFYGSPRMSLSLHSHRRDIIRLPPAHPGIRQSGPMPQFLICEGVWLWSVSSHFDFLSFRTTPDKCLARYALLLTLFFVGLLDRKSVV